MWYSVPLTLFWFFYMGSVGIFLPYYGLYLKENAKLSGTELGWVLATLPLVSVVAQPFWGQVADRTGARGRILTILSLGCVIGYLWLAAANGLFAMLLATGALALFVTSVLPITISISLAILRNAGPHAFGFVRVWGTIGYFLLIIGFPWILHGYQNGRGLSSSEGSVAGLEVMFVATAALALVAALIAWFLPREGAVSWQARQGDWRSLFNNVAYVRFLLFSFSAYLLSQGPMWLFPIFVRTRGGEIETIRNLWIVMLLVEIPLILATGSGVRWLGARGLLGVGVFAGGLRWILSAVATDLYLLALAQMLHGVTVVGLLLGGPIYLDLVTPARLRSTAQAVLSTVGFGIAGIASNLGSGWLLDRVGVDFLYAAAGLGSLILGALVAWVLPAPEGPRRRHELQI